MGAREFHGLANKVKLGYELSVLLHYIESPPLHY